MRYGVFRDESPSSACQYRAPTHRVRKGAAEEHGPRDPPFVMLQPVVVPSMPPQCGLDDNAACYRRFVFYRCALDGTTGGAGPCGILAGALKSLCDNPQLFVGHGFRGCGKSPFAVILSEAKNPS